MIPAVIMPIESESLGRRHRAARRGADLACLPILSMIVADMRINGSILTKSAQYSSRPTPSGRSAIRRSANCYWTENRSSTVLPPVVARLENTAGCFCYR